MCTMFKKNKSFIQLTDGSTINSFFLSQQKDIFIDSDSRCCYLKIKYLSNIKDFANSKYKKLFIFNKY